MMTSALSYQVGIHKTFSLLFVQLRNMRDAFLCVHEAVYEKPQMLWKMRLIVSCSGNETLLFLAQHYYLIILKMCLKFIKKEILLG